MRRLPIYILLDCSGSMMGEPITALQTGLQNLVATLRQDPYALETAYISVITFESEARQIVPLTELSQFNPPLVAAGGTTAMGAALTLLAERIEAEVTKSSLDSKGDWKPMVFLLTDGSPTDNLTEGIEALKRVKIGAFVACAAGPGAETKELSRITNIVVQMDTADSNTIKAFFKWATASISTSSNSVASNKEVQGPSDLPPPPAELNMVI